MQNNTSTALKPALYREYLAQCAAIGRHPLPAHSVETNGCWALVKPIAPRPSGHIAIQRSVNGKRYPMYLHTLSLLHAQAPAIYARIDTIQANGVTRAMACHKPICGGNKACFNPAHLRLDGNDGNARDRQRDGGYARGEAHGRAKLTDDQVAAIRAEAAAGASQRALGREYGASGSYIGAIVNRKARVHSDGRLL